MRPRRGRGAPKPCQIHDSGPVQAQTPHVAGRGEFFLDSTGERDLPRVLDELSLRGLAPRLVVITREARIRAAGEKALFSHPISHLLTLPSPNGSPIADPRLPFVLPALAAALAAAWPGKIERRPSAPARLEKKMKNYLDRKNYACYTTIVA